MPKPNLLSEIRGPSAVTEAAIAISQALKDRQSTGTYLPEVLERACLNLEKFYRMKPNTATEEMINTKTNLTVAGWADSYIEDWDVIDNDRKNREAAESAGNFCSLFPLTLKEKGTLNNVSPSEWILIDVIADSGACETVMPKSMCQGIKLR